METAFLEMQVLFRINIEYWIGLMLVFLCSHCAKRPGNGQITEPPKLEASIREGHFTSSKGLIYWKDTLFSGWRVAYHSNDQILEKTPIIDGQIHGTSLAFYANGNKRWERMYALGKKEGTHRMWYVDGQLKMEANYHADAYEGNAREWYPNGQLFRDFNYVNGHESGKQRIWKSDGRVKANYEVRDGRRYGLTGVKNCVNVFEE